MLSEAYLLFRALTDAGITPPRKHKRVTSPGQTSGPCLRVGLGAQGDVAAIESIGRDEWPGVWTVMDGRQNSFPVVRLKKSVFQLPDGSDFWAELGYGPEGERSKSTVPANDKRLELYERVLRDSLRRELSNQFWKRLSNKADELLQHSAKAQDSSAVDELAKRFQMAAKSPEILLRETAKKAVQQLKDARLSNFDVVELLLVGKKPKPRDKDKDKGKIAVQLAFDISDGNSVYTGEARDYVSGILPHDRAGRMRKKPGKEDAVANACAYTGSATALQDRAFPTVRLPVLNKDFPMVSMFSDARCNKRYGLTDARVVPVDRELAMRVKEALEYMVHADRKGKTWRGVASGKFEMCNGRKVEKQDLLIVYVEGMPAIDARVADFFGRDEDQVQTQFEADAQAVCSALDGICRQSPGSKMGLFLLRKVSEGQAKVAKAESFEVKNLLRSADAWRNAVRTGLPDVIRPYLPPKEKGGAAVRGRISAPYPDDVVRLLQHQWVRDGSSPMINGKRQKAYHEEEGIGLGSVIDIMLRVPGKWEQETRNVLHSLLRRVGPMLIGLGGAMNSYVHGKKDGRLRDFDGRARETFLCAISVLGILLDALGNQKERYMNESAFLVGRVFGLADTLHKQYCVVVRDGHIPASLIGNASLSRAFDNPRMAVADLAERIRIYVGWAQTVSEPAGNDRDGENKVIAVRTARKTLSRYKPLAEQLHKTGLPERCDEMMKAEMLLGYLASEKGMNDDQGDKQ